MPPSLYRLEDIERPFAGSTRTVIVIAWAVILLLARIQPVILYLAPPLALLTFSWLPPLPIILIGILLSSTLGNASGLQSPTKIALIGVTWIAALVMVARAMLKQRSRASAAPDIEPALSTDADERLETPIPTPAPPPQSVAPGDTMHTLRHELRTPINMIEGYCEALLRPSAAHPQPLPDAFRADIEAIQRNAQQLDGLIDGLLRDPARLSLSQGGDSAAPQGRAYAPSTVILLDADGAISDLLSLYTSRFTVIRTVSVEEIGRLGAEVEPTAVIINAEDDTLIPLVAQVVGRQIPILMLSLVGNSAALRTLSKPIQFEALESMIKGGGTTLREALIIDDNRDSVDLLSRMILSMPQALRLLKAYSGHEALALLKERVPDIIFLDFVLPDLDGTVILDYLRASSRLSHVPVVLMSAHRPLDMLTVSRASKLTLFHLAGLSPVKLAHHIESLIADATNDSA